jgi:hypothetical protein
VSERELSLEERLVAVQAALAGDHSRVRSSVPPDYPPRAPGWIIPAGLNGEGEVDNSPQINEALESAKPGDVVYLPRPSVAYGLLSSLSMREGVTLMMGHSKPLLAGGYLRPLHAFGSPEVIHFGPLSEGAKLQGIAIDGSYVRESLEVHGWNAVGQYAKRIQIDDCSTYKMTGDGQRAEEYAGGFPHSWRSTRVYHFEPKGNGFNIPNMTDCTWTDCQSLNAGKCGWLLEKAQANSHFIGCRGEWSAEHNWHLTGEWNTGTGAGGCIFTSCSSDRAEKHGCLIDATGTVPVLFNGWMGRRDGRNNKSGGGGYAGIAVSKATIPVLLGALTIFPGVDDTGEGTNSPEYGLSIVEAAYCNLAGPAFIRAQTSSIHESGNSGPNFRRGINNVNTTGATTATTAASNFKNTAGTDSGSPFNMLASAKLYSGQAASEPTLAAGSANGGTPPAPKVLGQMSDMRGQVEFGSGSAPSAGQQVVVKFAQEYTDTPVVIVCASNTAAAALELIAVVANGKEFELKTGKAPAAEQAVGHYVFSYFVIG